MPPRVLVVCKLSVLQSLAARTGPTGVAEFFRRVPGAEDRYRLADEENRKTIDTVRGVLTARGVEQTVLMRPLSEPAAAYDLVVTVGGDGTFLAAAHGINGVPVLGVNSSRSSSVGHFCAADATTFEALLDDALAGRARPALLYRLELTIDGVPREPAVLNDVLFAHAEPAGTSRYVLQVGERSERQKSSGIWVSTASGSTGAAQSAGGEPMPQSGNPAAQFLVREPYPEPGSVPTLIKGEITDPIVIRNLTRSAGLFIDGGRVVHRVPLGATVQVWPGRRPLQVFMPAETPSG